MSWQEDIERYVENRMSDSERKLFEQTMESSIELKSEYELYIDARMLLNVAGYMHQKERIKNLDTPSKNSVFLRLAVAASLILGLALAGWWALQLDPNQREFASFFEPYPDRITVLGTSDRHIDQAMTHYNQGEYEKAIDAFALIESSNDSLGLLKLYEAISYLAIDSCQRSTKILVSLEGKPSTLSEAVTWYTILSLYRCDQTDAAMTKLDHYLQRETVFNASRAKALQAHLKKE